MRLLLVEDDPMLGDSVQCVLQQESFAVDWARDGEEAELALNAFLYDCVLLDLGLPGKNGLDLLHDLRKRKSSMPVIILTARDAVSDRVAGLDSGADDYLVKPFDPDELTARIRALLRRRDGRVEPLITFGTLTLNPATHELYCQGRPIRLSLREFSLISLLLERPGATVSREQLEERLYGWNEEVESNAIGVHIHNLRKKLGHDLIRTVRGVGYMVIENP
ncbi:MAG: response regulator transcription factor [Oryzomonas sp.]|uniref:response regulator transcription factor n=1 Tax=Oryzomonas sp. TaxID=2855186 RepID=UPI0028481C10|nr:response regulator transcription factor [Oryzomonas sp.]MDR3580991.1 response regulator transcription factor [Oryzomonas sp.]